MAPPEKGHNRSISERNEFFNMSVGGEDNPVALREEDTLEMVAITPATAPALREDEEDIYNDTDVEEAIDRLHVAQRSVRAIVEWSRNHLRFLHLSVVTQERMNGTTAHTAAMRTRLQDMIGELHRFETNDTVNRAVDLMRVSRSLFVDSEDSEDCDSIDISIDSDSEDSI